MKLIIAIVRDTDSDLVSQALTSRNFRVTGIASTGGFLRRGNTTLLIGLDDERVDEALTVIRDTVSAPSSQDEQRGVLFVLKVDQHDHF